MAKKTQTRFDEDIVVQEVTKDSDPTDIDFQRGVVEAKKGWPRDTIESDSYLAGYDSVS